MDCLLSERDEMGKEEESDSSYDDESEDGADHEDESDGEERDDDERDQENTARSIRSKQRIWGSTPHKKTKNPLRDLLDYDTSALHNPKEK